MSLGGFASVVNAQAPVRAGLPASSGAALKLNDAGYEHAVQLIAQGHVVLDKRDEWGVHRPTGAAQGAFIDQHGYGEYGGWFLGVNDAFDVDTRRRYEFPYGDFEVVRRSALLAARYRARQWGHAEVEAAAERLLSLMAARAPA